MKAKGIVIRNEQERKAVEVLTKAHEWMCSEYGVNPSLKFQRECNWGKDAFHAGWYRNSDNTIALNFRNMYGATIKDLISVLGHEFRHAIQYKTGMLKDYGRCTKKVSNKNSYTSGIWNGENLMVKYIDAPWEVDAREYQDEYADACIKDLRLKSISKTKIPYGTKTESDKRATHAKITAKYTVNEFIALANSWISDKKRTKDGGIAYVLYKDLPKAFNIKNRKDQDWLFNKGQKKIKFMKMVKVTSKYGGFTVEQMVS